MAHQRPGKTYLSAAQKAEKEAAEKAKEEEKDKQNFRRRRRPPPRFSELFIKKKKEEKEFSEQSKENISLFSTGTKVEAIFNNSQASRGHRKPLRVNNSLTNSTNSIPSFSDTFDKICSKPSCATQPQMPKYLCSSSSSSECHPDSSGMLFKSLLSMMSSCSADKSASRSCRRRNYESQAQQNNNNNNEVKPQRKPDEPSSKESQKPSTRPVYSPQLFTSMDIIVDKENESSNSPSPKPKTKTLRQRTHGKQAFHRQQVTKATKGVSSSETHTRNTLRIDSVVDVQVREPPTSHPSLPKVQPSPLVQRFLNSVGISCTPPVQSSPLGPSLMPHMAHQNIKSGSPHLSGKSSGKSSVHTSTPTERGKWSAHGSPSLEIKVSPVPREVDIMTDNSLVFQSPSPPTEGKRGHSQGQLGGSPSLPSTYETCISSGRFREDSSSTNQQFVTGETCDSEKDGASIRITRGMFKGVKIPKIAFESPPEQEPRSHGTNSGTDQMILNSEPSVIIVRRTRAKKAIKRLESSQSTFTTQSPKMFITGRNGKTLSPWLAKRFSPKVTRSQSRLLGQQSEESHDTDLSHFGNSSHASEGQRSWATKWGHEHKKSLHRGNLPGRKSKRLAAQKSETTLDTDESTTSSLHPLERSETLERRRKRTQRTSIISRGANRSPQGLPPTARRSVRLSRKRNAVRVLVPTRRSQRLLIHDHSTSTRLEHNVSRSSSKAEGSIIHAPSDCSSIFNFRPRRERRNNQLIFHQRSTSQSSTLASVDSWPPASTHSSQHIGETCGNLEGTVMGTELQNATGKESKGLESYQLEKMGGGVAREYGLEEALVMTRLEESGDISRENVSAFGPLPTLPTKPGKGWRRSIAIQARAASLTSVEQVNDMPPPSTSGPHRKLSGRSISSFPLELNHRHHRLRSTNLIDSPRRSVLQMSFCGEEKAESAPSAPALDPRRQVLELCSQEEPLPLTHCFTESRLACCRKIGEGVYGEVFMTRPNPASLKGATVLKIMPIEGDFLVNGEPQKKFEEILSEMVISLELSGLRTPERQCSMTENFVHVQGSWCVEGRYPQDLIHLWDLYMEEKGSENDRPDIFPDTQLYVVLEFGHGGRDLESFVFNNARDLTAVFLQITYSLAVAEEALEFEHRDLHWGNVLVAPTTEAKIDFKLGGETYTLNTYGLKATVIDFTLSRIKLPHCVVFNNLAEDPSLFTSEGDYQFEVYRQMQHATNNTWETFKPYTNVLWLHYLLVKMTSQCYIKNSKTKLHRTHHSQLTKMKDAMLSYESAIHYVLCRESGE